MGRYSDFWIRQGMIGQGIQVPTNFATVALFNNTVGAHNLVVRNWMADGTGTTQTGRIALLNSRIAFTSHGNVVPMLPTEAPQAGVIDQLDSAAITLTTYHWPFQFGNTSLSPNIEIPFCAIPPGWSLIFQLLGTGTTLRVGIQWEAVEPDQMDPFWEKVFESV